MRKIYKSLSIVVLLTSECNNLIEILNSLFPHFQTINTEYIIVDTVDIDIESLNLFDLHLPRYNVNFLKIVKLNDKLYQSIAELKNDVIQYVSGKYMMLINMAEMQDDTIEHIDLSNIVKYITMSNEYIDNSKDIKKIDTHKIMQDKYPSYTSRFAKSFQDVNNISQNCQNQDMTLTLYKDVFKEYIVKGDINIAFLCLNVDIVLSLSGWNTSIVCGEDYELLLRLCDIGSRGLLENFTMYNACSMFENFDNFEKPNYFDKFINPLVIPVCYQGIEKPVYQDMYYTYSYILGKYSNKLKQWNLLNKRSLFDERSLFDKRSLFDTVFQNRYKEAVSFGIEDYFVRSCEQMIGHSDEFFKVNNNTNPIIIMMNSSMCNGAMQSFAEGLADALIKYKQAVLVVDMDWIEKQKDKSLSKQIYKNKDLHNDEYDIERNINTLLLDIAECDCKAVVGFQMDVFARQAEDGDLWGNKITCPKINITFDHPLYISYNLMIPIKNHYICSQDEEYVKYIKEYYPNVKDAWHLPPGGILPKKINYNHFNERRWDLTFVAAYSNYREGVAAIRMMEKADRKLALNLMIYLKNNPNISANEGFKKVLEAEGIKLNKKEFVVKLHHMRDAVRTISFYYREKIVRILVDSGIDIHVFSNTWHNCPYADNEHLIIHGDVSFDDGVEIMADSKISLNIMSWHKGGMTERIANAMLAGSVCVSDKTSYLEKNFTDGKDIILFDLENIYSLPQKIKNLLADMDTASKIAAKGKENALKHHTWLNRANSLMEILREIDE